MSNDQKFFDIYSLVIGVLVVFAVFIWILATRMSDNTQGVYTKESAEYQEAIAERIRPLGEVYLPGEEQMAAAPVVAAAAEPEPVAAALTGPQVYNQACLACHGAGIGGAPVLGETAVWSARIAQGQDTLYRHAIEGYTGEAGYMPPKGGRIDLSDQEVRDAVDYMVAEAQ